MKKLIKHEICGSVNSARMHCSQKTGQKLRLLFMYRTWTVTACGGKTREKKKWRGKRRNATQQNATLYPNITIITRCSFFFAEIVTRFFFFFCWNSYTFLTIEQFLKINFYIFFVLIRALILSWPVTCFYFSASICSTYI